MIEVTARAQRANDTEIKTIIVLPPQNTCLRSK